MKFYTIYETVNKINGQNYIGKHITDNPNDSYLGSGKYLKRAIKKYGIENFEKTVLFIFDNKEDMDKKEEELVDDVYLNYCKTYNLKLGGQGGFDYVNENGFAKSKEHFKIASEIRLTKHKGKLKEWSKNGVLAMQKAHKEGRVKYGVSFKDKHHTEETKKRMSEKHMGKHTGKNNPMYGKCWIHNDKENRVVLKTDLDFYDIGNTWELGRKMKFE